MTAFEEDWQGLKRNAQAIGMLRRYITGRLSGTWLSRSYERNKDITSGRNMLQPGLRCGEWLYALQLFAPDFDTVDL